MMTLEQFRATGLDVPEISRYDDTDYDRAASGRVYMDGTLSIERVGDGWVLTIGNEQYDYDTIGPLEKILYEWAKDEYGSMFDTEYRIPPCPIEPTEDEMRGWFEAMHERGLSFHPDDDPSEVVSSTQNKFLFHDNEVEALRRIQRNLFRMHGDRVHGVCCEVAGIAGEEERE